MRTTIGAFAHVDAGKTTLSESILYKTNVIRNKGRVDNANSFLDYNSIEKEKGITVFNKLANFSYENHDYIYLDTPGHNDLGNESNRALDVIDCAIVLISAIEDIPTDTIKKFNELLKYNIPIIIFINKMDISNFSKDEILNKIRNKLSIDCIDNKETYEFMSLVNDDLLNEYLTTNTIDSNTISKYLSYNYFFPCFFGSALKDNGIDELLTYINKYVHVQFDDKGQSNAYVFKIENEYSYIKVLSGKINNKDCFGEYKINEMYAVNGNNFIPIASATAGDIVAVKGIKDIPIGTYIPSFNINSINSLPSIEYRIISNLNSNELYKTLEPLKNEMPELKINLSSNNVTILLNGELHSTIIKKIVKDKFNIDIDFSKPIIKYKETINSEVYGVGHYEPLRHYGEAIIRLKPNDNGIKVNSLIENSYTNTLVSYLRNYPIKGILTNSHLTNIEITIIDIKTHPKHTEGGDLIQSVKRAIRQGLTKISSILLEPNYIISINLDEYNTNEIISFLTMNKIEFSIKEDKLLATIPIINFNDIVISLKSKLRGQLDFTIEETTYLECHNQNEVIDMIGYDYRSDMHNPSGSVFCKAGAGHYVEPEDVENCMHLDMSNYVESHSNTSISHNRVKISDEELNRVWSSLYKPRPRFYEKKDKKEEYKYKVSVNSKPLVYLIDGYNLTYFFDEDNAISNLMSARENIINLVCDFAGYVNAEVILVFDAFKTDLVNNEIMKNDNITIVYTKHKLSADQYIENKSKELEKTYKVNVVTSDSLEQLHVYANSASVISSSEFISRYNNLRKNSTKLNSTVKFRPLEDIKDYLE